MSVDSSIALQAKLPTFDNPLTQYAQVAAIQNAQQQNRLADLTYADKQREVSSDNALANLLAGGKTGDDVVTGLAAQGYGKNALGYAKTMQEQAKTKLEIQKQQSELIDAKLKQSRAYLDGVTTPEQYLAWHEANHKDPILGPALAARGVTAEQSRATINAAMQQPGGFDQLLNQSRMGIEKFAEANKPTVHMQNLGGTSQIVSTPGMGGAPTVLSTSPITQSPDSVASNATSQRGQDMSQATAVRGQDLTNERALEINDGKMEELKLKRAEAKDKPLTEFQGKSTGYAARAQEADKLIGTLAGYSPATINAKASVEGFPLIGGAMGAAVNKFSLSQKDQQAEQAQRDFINAILRQESGAAIGASEFDSARKQYFDQPGDGADVKLQKAKNRALAIEGLKASAGPGASKLDGMVDMAGKTSAVARAAAKTGDPANYAPKPGTVEGGYRFKGGNPSDSRAWEKV